MGANFQFDKMLPSIDIEAKSITDPKRQVQVFTHDGELWLRIGAINQEDSGVDRVTVKLSAQHAKEIIAAIESGIAYLGGG